MDISIEKPDTLWHIDQFKLLKTLTMAERMELKELMCMTHYEKGAEIYLPSEQHDHIYFLKAGHVKVSKIYEEGHEHVIEVIGQGELFGQYMPGLEDETNEKATALDNCTICHIDVDKWNNFISTNPKFSLSVLKLVGWKFKKLESRLEDLQFKKAEERIATVINNLMDKFGRKIGVGFETEVKLHLTHEDMAKLSGTTRQTVTTFLRNLEKKNIISYDRKRILIKDKAALKTYL